MSSRHVRLVRPPLLPARRDNVGHELRRGEGHAVGPARAAEVAVGELQADEVRDALEAGRDELGGRPEARELAVARREARGNGVGASEARRAQRLGQAGGMQLAAGEAGRPQLGRREARAVQRGRVVGGRPERGAVESGLAQRRGRHARELYAAAQAQRPPALVIGGTCDSVGVGGCFLGGCFGTWSKRFGSAASNLLQATAVLADGSVVTANACQHSDLFWALRGGGGGTFAAVAELVVRTHAPPRTVLLGSHSFGAVDRAAFVDLLAQATLASRRFMAPPWGGGLGFARAAGPGGQQYSVSLGPKGYEVDEAEGAALLQPLLDFVAANASRFPNAKAVWAVWNASTAAPGAPLPWIEIHPDREISTMMVASFGRLPTMAQTATPAGLAAVAEAFAAVADQVPASMQGTVGLDFEKGQAGASAEALELLAQTSQNPVLEDAIGLLLVAFRFPFLPTLPRTSAVLAALWPRLQQYVVRGASDALFADCAAGAAGDEARAAQCLGALAEQRAPALQAGALAAVNSTLRGAFGNDVSGGYTNEAEQVQHSPRKAGAIATQLTQAPPPFPRCSQLPRPRLAAQLLGRRELCASARNQGHLRPRGAICLPPLRRQRGLGR